MHYGNAITAGGAFFTGIRKSSLPPGEGVAIHDVARPIDPLGPGDYKLHVILYNRYATYPGKPEQDLVQPFRVEP